LIVNIISADKRYEVANYKNVFIPTNFDVTPAVKPRFAEFYAALFDRTIATNPGAVVTEYAWTAVPNYHCDPCTDADISNPDLMTLGGDVVGGQIAAGHFVLTRLHARYGTNDMKDDLRFRVAQPVVGGREHWAHKGLEYGAAPSPQSFFQARYAIRHAWTGPIKCANPQRGVWGGPPNGNDRQVIAAGQLAFAPRGKLEIASVIKRDLPEIGVLRGVATAPNPPPSGPDAPRFATPPRKAQSLGAGAALGALMLAALWLVRRRRTGR
jgi:MYXO-CTERM domain-containing protein